MAMDAAEIVTAESILAGFSDLEDRRSTVTRVHVLGDIVNIPIMAAIAWSVGAQDDRRLGTKQQGFALGASFTSTW